MTAAQQGMLLLCCALGQPEAHPLTTAQFRDLGLRIRAAGMDGDGLRSLCSADLRRAGVPETQADQILRLLDRETVLEAYLRRAKAMGIYPLVRIDPDYPHRVAAKLRFSCPPVLFCRGDRRLLALASVAAVGSRRLLPENAAFARQAGRLAARERLTLVSGGAVGADQEAQAACLAEGGRAVVFVADALTAHPAHSQVLFCSAGGYDLPFSTHRALARNGLIHTQGDRTLVAQCSYGTGGTWQGSLENLKHGWSELYVFDDRSPGAAGLIERGATGLTQLTAISSLTPSQLRLL